MTSGDGCSATCSIETGATCFGEPSRCTPQGACGDSTVVFPAECDDGNALSGDGCTPSRELEPGFVRCGNGWIDDSNEQCDDANTLDGDGCSAQCEFEYGATCHTHVSPTACTTPPDLGTFAAGYAIPDLTSKTTILRNGEVFYHIAFTQDVFTSGSLTAGTSGADIDLNIIPNGTTSPMVSFVGAGDETFTNAFLPAGRYLLRIPACDDSQGFTLALQANP